jgi:UDP-MurNAc hydroxylase
MLMEWVNHASFILRSGSASLICDPWLRGRIFNGGWSLLSPTRWTHEGFRDIDYIWLSQEYPDHFSPGDLMAVPEECRERITVLFHNTKDKRVVTFCRNIGFKTRELPNREIVSLGQDFSMMCGTWGLLNSWAAFFIEGKTFLNLNDCSFDQTRELEKIRSTIGPVDVLLSQFSYSRWVGNPGDANSRARHADRTLTEMSQQIRTLQPAVYIPFASFVYFCHAENVQMNSGANQIGDVYHYLTRELGVPALVLYPGDTWEPGAPHDSAESIRRYNEDLAQACKSSLVDGDSIDADTLWDAGVAFFARSSDRNDQLVLNALPPAIAYLRDLDVHVELSFRSGLKFVDNRKPDIILSSDSLLHCLTNDWGGEVLITNGRFEAPPGGRPRRFFWIFRAPRHTSVGNSLALKFLERRAAEKGRAAASR